MKYDLKEVFGKGEMVSLTWHGEDTLVQVEKNAAKVPVAQGETIGVPVELARQLLTSYSLWTLEGDEPLDQPWMEARKAAADARGKKAKTTKKEVESAEETTPDDVMDLTPEAIGKMKKDDVVAALETLEVEGWTKGDKVGDLKELLLDTVSGISETAEDVEEEVEDEATSEE